MDKCTSKAKYIYIYARSVGGAESIFAMIRDNIFTLWKVLLKIAAYVYFFYIILYLLFIYYILLHLLGGVGYFVVRHLQLGHFFVLSCGNFLILNMK